MTNNDYENPRILEGDRVPTTMDESPERKPLINLFTPSDNSEFYQRFNGSEQIGHISH